MEMWVLEGNLPKNNDRDGRRRTSRLRVAKSGLPKKTFNTCNESPSVDLFSSWARIIARKGWRQVFTYRP